MTKSIAERMEEAADTNLGLPYSLMCDAWDLLAQEWPQDAFTREQFESALAHRLDVFDADPLGYQFHPGATD